MNSFKIAVRIDFDGGLVRDCKMFISVVIVIIKMVQQWWALKERGCSMLEPSKLFVSSQAA
jgi:hypothetical protein